MMHEHSWSMVGAEVQGLGHRKKNIPCQDKTFCIERNKVKVISLADGAGSVKLSHLGAAEITEVLSTGICDEFDHLFALSDNDLKDSLAAQIEQAVNALSNSLDCPRKELASTLLLVAVRKNRFLAVHVGDGVIGSFCNGKLAVLSEPQNGEYANMTWFTTSEDLRKAIRVYRGDAAQYSGFILMSDGVEPSLYEARSHTLAEAVINLFYMNAKIDAKQMEELLKESLETVISPRTNDDCSISILSRSRFKKYDEYSKYRRKCAKRESARKRGEHNE